MTDTQTKTLQYKQLDFLRLFRLSRELGIVRRKRKMPIQYERSTHINSSCSKLFKTFLTGLFEDSDIQVDNRRGVYTIQTPEGAGEKLSFLNQHRQYLSNQGEASIIAGLDAIGTDASGFITGPVQYNYNNFTITASPNTNGRYQAVAAGLENVAELSRPREEYFRCAKACLDYKARWNEHVGRLCAYADENRASIENGAREERDRAARERMARLERDQRALEERRLEERRQRDEQRRQREAERQRQLEETERAQAEMREMVQSRAQQVHNENRTRAQSLFDEALSRRRTA